MVNLQNSNICIETLIALSVSSPPKIGNLKKNQAR